MVVKYQRIKTSFLLRSIPAPDDRDRRIFMVNFSNGRIPIGLTRLSPSAQPS